ncbi:MAG: hypothetical protein KJP00_14875 [Bacteroidia bacterium]|nr:hypothetical protein [Bacteroidia bacterium]
MQDIIDSTFQFTPYKFVPVGRKCTMWYFNQEITDLSCSPNGIKRGRFRPTSSKD